jgi:hypothetical protein
MALNQWQIHLTADKPPPPPHPSLDCLKYSRQGYKRVCVTVGVGGGGAQQVPVCAFRAQERRARAC